MNDVPQEYVLARRVLLDALDALGPQIEAVVLVGAQAVYLHTGRSRVPARDQVTGDVGPPRETARWAYGT